MAAPRKRTAKKTTTSRSRAPAKSGRSSTSFIAMGMIAGLGIAILFYTIFIRQDANLSKGNMPQYAHTPSQSNVLNPLPPRPSQEQAPTVSVPQAPTEPPLSIAESLAQQSESQPSVPLTIPQEEPKVAAQTTTKAPTTKTTPPKQPTPGISEDAIGNLIAQNQKSAPNQVKAQTPQSKSTVTSKDDADHVGALIRTMPSNTSSPKDTTTSDKTLTVKTIAAKSPIAETEKVITLNPAPTKERPFFLQTAFYKTENEADAMRAQLLLLGHSSANVHKALVNNQTVYRVRVGPYTSSADLEKAQTNLETAKLKLSPIH